MRVNKLSFKYIEFTLSIVHRSDYNRHTHNLGIIYPHLIKD